MDRVCTTYLKDLNSLTLPTNSCSSIFTMDTKEARDAVNHINTETNAWIQITTISATIPSILVDCFMGGWSDLFGRKMPMYLPSVLRAWIPPGCVWPVFSAEFLVESLLLLPTAS